MPQIKIQNHAGMNPARDPTLLPDNYAAYSRNTWLYSGNIQGFRTSVLIHTLSNQSAKTVYRAPLNDPYDYNNSVWMEFTDEYTNVIRAPITQDKYKRYYFFSPTDIPKYNPLSAIQSGTAALTLGIPTPTYAPSVATIAPTPSKSNSTYTTLTKTNADGTTTDTITVTPITETRSYLYTWVSEYGEEGAPSPPVVVTAQIESTFTVTTRTPSSSDTTGRKLASVRVYRTVTDAAGYANYYLVATLPISSFTFDDTIKDANITSSTILESSTWTPPPSDLQGCVAMPNGILAGWSNDKEIWFSEPYRPHAWPAVYSISVDYKIVGLGVLGTSLIIMTEGNPYVASGVTPSSMSLSKLPIHEPCISRSSIVSAADGVYYASINGLVQVTPGNVKVVSDTLLTRQDWSALTPSQIVTARYGTAYMGFCKNSNFTDGSGDNGIIIDPAQENALFNYLRFTPAVTNVVQDEMTGSIFILSGGKVYNWDAPNSTTQMPYVWRSKVFQFPFRQQFVAAQIFFDVPSSITITPTAATRNTAQPQTFDSSKQYFVLRVYADSRLVLTREVQKSGELIQIPSGFKGNFWQFEIEGQVVISNIQVATSIKELGSV